MSPLGHGLNLSSPCPCVFPYGVYVSMGHVRRKPKLLPDKLVIIREHLGIVPVDMARKLEAAH